MACKIIVERFRSLRIMVVGDAHGFDHGISRDDLLFSRMQIKCAAALDVDKLQVYEFGVSRGKYKGMLLALFIIPRLSVYDINMPKRKRWKLNHFKFLM